MVMALFMMLVAVRMAAVNLVAHISSGYSSKNKTFEPKVPKLNYKSRFNKKKAFHLPRGNH